MPDTEVVMCLTCFRSDEEVKMAGKQCSMERMVQNEMGKVAQGHMNRAVWNFGSSTGMMGSLWRIESEE